MGWCLRAAAGILNVSSSIMTIRLTYDQAWKRNIFYPFFWKPFRFQYEIQNGIHSKEVIMIFLIVPFQALVAMCVYDRGDGGSC